MGVSDLSVILPSATGGGGVKTLAACVSPRGWRMDHGSIKKSKKKLFKQLVVTTSPTAKQDRWQQTVVSKLCQGVWHLTVARPLSPQPIADDNDAVHVASPPSSSSFRAEWLVNEQAVALNERVLAVLSTGASRVQMTSEGCGGAYFVQDTSAKQTVAIFKPRDEEYMAPHNPRGYVQEQAIVGVTDHPVNKGFRVGNGALRERAAYLLDAAYGHFSGVPVTTLTTLCVGDVAKEGSLQAFVASECSAEDMGTLKFSIPEVHKIGILDVRLFNTDRHAGNILLQPQTHEQAYGMTPIDHGFCLPSFRHLDNANFDWLQWPQTQFPFTSAELEHIATLNPAQDAAMLRALGMEEACVTTMRIGTAMLQLGAEAGFSLYEIASNLQRDGDFSTPSPLEEIVAQAVVVVELEQGLTEAVSGQAFHDAVVSHVVEAAMALFADQPKKKVRSISCFS